MSMPPPSDEVAAAVSLDDVAGRLSNRRNGALILSGEAMQAQEVADLLGALDLTELALADPQTSRTADAVSVSGKAQLLGAAVDASVTFAVPAGALTVALHAALEEHTLQLPALPWVSVDDLALDLSVSGPCLAVPVVTGSLSGNIALKGLAKPIRVSVRPGPVGWILTAANIPLPDPLATLGQMLPVQNEQALMPKTLSRDVLGLEIVELSCGFDPSELSVHSLGVTIGAPGQTWKFADGLPGVTDLTIGFTVDFPRADAERELGGGEGAPSFSVSGGATILLGGLKLPIRVLGGSYEWRFGIIGAHGFTSLGELVTTVTDADTAAMLPAALSELRMKTASVDVAVAASDGALRSISFSAALAKDWPIVKGHLAIEGLALQVFVDRAGADTSGFVTGAIRLEEAVEIPVAVEKPPGAAPWTLKLGTDATPKLSGVSALTGAVGGDDPAKHLPSGFPGGELELKNLTIAFDATSHAVKQIDLEVHSGVAWPLPGLSNVDVGELALTLHAAWPGPEVTGSIGGTVDVDGTAVTIRASKPSGTAPWKIEGELAPGSSVDLKAFAAAFGDFDLPPALREASLTTLGIAFDTSGGFSFDGVGKLTVEGETLALELHADVKKAAGGSEATFTGLVTIAERKFKFGVKGDSAQTRFVASYAHGAPDAQGAPDADKGVPEAIAVKDLVAAVAPTIAKDIPDTLVVELRDVIFATAAGGGPTRVLFALDLERIDLSGLPLVGTALADSATVEDLQVVAATAPPVAANPPDPGDIAAWNAMLLTEARPLPAQGVDRGVFVAAKLNLGDTSAPVGLEVPSSAPPPAGGTAAPAADDTKWFPVQRSFGPVHLGRVGARYDAGVLWLLLDASLSLGGLSIALNGLSVGSPLQKFDPQFHLDGLGLSFRQDPVEIAGAFLAVPGKDLGNASFQYDGAAVVRAEVFTLAAVGSYAEVAGQPSLFVFAELDTALGGPPAAYVTGLMGGFGYNRALRLPEQDEIFQFPFLQGLGGASAGDGTPLGVLAVLEGRPPQPSTPSTQPSTPAKQPSTPAPKPSTKPWLTVAPGESWLAVGLTFTSFEVAETHALLIAEFGHELQFALVGLTKLRLPRDMPDKPFAYVELQFEAVLKPQEGFFGLSAQLSPNSFVFAPECRLTGGFAFYVWFDGDHAGDFVLTIGGYHPAFTPKPWYPQEPRLGLHWPVNDLVTVDGEAYFALTPSCVMGGGGLHVLFHDGNLQAWLKASANFLISWAPFRYSVDIGVSVGVSYRVDWGLIQKTFSVELGAQLSLWGPPTGGTAYVSWWVISFSIDFGAGPPEELTLKGWDDFKPMLPAEADLCKVVIQSGLLPGAAGRDAVAGASESAVVRADALQIATECAVPATQLKLATTADAFATPEKQSPAIRPLGLAEIDSQHTLHVRDSRGHEIDLKKDEWTIEARTRNVPEALWGAPLKPKENPPPSANLVEDQLAGFTIKPPGIRTGPTRGAVSMGTALEAVPVGSGVLPPTRTSTSAPAAPAKGAVKAIEGVADAAAARTAIRIALGTQYLDPVPDDKLDAFAAAAAALFPVAPMLSGPVA
jgi:hypothetical protein